MARSDAAISIVQFDEASLTHLAVVPSGSGFRVEAQETRRADGPVDGVALRAFADACDVARDALYTVLPRHRVTVRILTLPAQAPDEIAAMVALSAGEFAPYPRDSLLVKHGIIAELPGGESRVLVVLIHRDELDRHLALLAAAGLEPRDVFLSTACMHAAAVSAPGAPAGRFALIHLSVAGIEVAVVEDGVLQFSRGAAHDSPWDLGGPQSRESLMYELRDALSAYRRECDDGIGVETLFVGGEVQDVEALAAMVHEATGTTCHAAAFVAGLLEGGGADAGTIPLIGLGAALAATGRAPLAISLLPPSLSRDRAFRGMQRQALRAAALAGVVLAALVAWFAQAVVQRTLLARELQARLDALAPSAQGVAAKQERLHIISRQVDQDGGILPLLAAVAAAAPESGFNVTRILYSRGEGLDIWGRALTKDLVLTDFLGALRGMGEGGLSMLARAHSQYETAGRERNQLIFNYHVAVPVLEKEGLDEAVPAMR